MRLALSSELHSAVGCFPAFLSGLGAAVFLWRAGRCGSPGGWGPYRGLAAALPLPEGLAAALLVRAFLPDLACWLSESSQGLGAALPLPEGQALALLVACWLLDSSDVLLVTLPLHL